MEFLREALARLDGLLRIRLVWKREKNRSPGRKLFDFSGDTFRLFVTPSAAAPAEVWRDCNRRADVEKQ